MSLDINGLAELVLPKVREQLHAEAVILVSAGRDRASCLVGRPVVSVGRNRLDDRTCTPTRRTIPPARPAPAGGAKRLSEPAGISGIHRACGASSWFRCCVRTQWWRWLLAINRLYTLCDVADHRRCEASHHEFGATRWACCGRQPPCWPRTRRTSTCSTTRNNCSWTWCGRSSTPWKRKTGTPSDTASASGMYAKHLAAALGLKATVCQRIYLAGLLHDVGKIAVRDDLLCNAQQLDDHEYRGHPAPCRRRLEHPLRPRSTG